MAPDSPRWQLATARLYFSCPQALATYVSPLVVSGIFWAPGAMWGRTVTLHGYNKHAATLMIY